jgi:flap endonuclease-1
LGVDLGEIVPSKRIRLEELSGKSLAVDAYNTLYQFLAIIRQPDGTPLMNRRGEVTSHLSGILYRTSNLVEKGIKLVYVFDGEPPELKEMEIKRRRQLKEEAAVKYEEALRAGRREEARKYAQMTSQLKDRMVKDSQRLLTALGIPWVQAPSEGEAQAAYMAMKGDVWAVASQDHDSLLFGAPRMVKNLTITGRRKLPRKSAYIEVEPELIDLSETLKELGLTRDQLIEIGILIGTDFNPEGVKGIGPKTALKALKEHGSLLEVLKTIESASFPVDPFVIKEIFLNPKVTTEYRLEWKRPDVDAVVAFLCEEKDFSEDRVRKALEKMVVPLHKPAEKETLERFFR